MTDRMKWIFSIIFTAVACLNLLEAVSIQSNKEFECNKEGRFADPLECSSFYECLFDKDKNLLKVYKRTCYGLAFNQQTGTCTRPEKVKGCKIRKSRQYSISTRFSKLCQNNVNNFICGDCATQITCSDGQAFETKCENNLRCVEGLSGFKGGVCHLQYADECRCKKPDTYYQDPYFNGTFFLCRENDFISMFYNCPFGLYFDNITKTCLSQDGTPPCVQKGLFAYPGDCNRYYMCTYAVEGWVQSKLKCLQGLLFNDETEVCENPCNWELKDFQCKAEGRFSNPKDCNQYFECILDLNGQLIKMIRSCPPRYHWDENKIRCIPRSESACKIKSEGPINQCRKDYEEICEKEGPIEEESSVKIEDQNENMKEKIPSKEGSDQENESANNEIKEQTAFETEESVLYLTTENSLNSQSSEKQELILIHQTQLVAEHENVTPVSSSIYQETILTEVSHGISEAEAETSKNPLNNDDVTTDSIKLTTIPLTLNDDQYLAITQQPTKNMTDSSEGIPDKVSANASAAPEVTEPEQNVESNKEIEIVETQTNDKGLASISTSTSINSTTEDFKDQSQAEEESVNERVTEGSITLSTSTFKFDPNDKVAEGHENHAPKEPVSSQIPQTPVNFHNTTKNIQLTMASEQEIEVSTGHTNESTNKIFIEIEPDESIDAQITTEAIQEENNNPLESEIENNQNPPPPDFNNSIFAGIKSHLQILKKKSQTPVAMVTSKPKIWK